LADGSVYPHKGRFAFLDRQVDPKKGTIQVAVSFPNPELTLRPGQYGIARAKIQTIPNALLIPQKAVSQLQGSNMVAVVNPDGKAEIRAIKVGETYQGLIVVSDGLKAGEKVIVEGFQRVRQGTPVSAKPYEAPKTGGAKNDSETKPSAGQS
jgi:membrane fusion protein, multidrug efflux system